jgi:hypothetical protein
MADMQEAKRYPLSFTQEWFLGLDKGDGGGTFGSRFIMLRALRVTGPVDIAVLQGSLDDVVARHESLRTVVVRDADPPYQNVLPPCPVPLELRDLTPAPGQSRDLVVRDLILEAERGSVSAREVPLMKARLCRFDDKDSVLLLTVHHSACDASSMQFILSDLAAFYLARRTGTVPELPPMRQYREYAQWQRATATSTAEDGAPKYWQHKLDGAREFEIPNNHGHPERYSRPYSGHGYEFGVEVAAPANDLATATRSTMFMVTLSAFYVLGHALTGDTDLTIRALTAGRNEVEFGNTMGLFLNCVPFRTDIAGCRSFRDILLATRDTFIDALANELPVNVIEQTFPDFIKPREDLRRSQFLLSDTPQLSGGDATLTIADGACVATRGETQDEEFHDVPSGAVWHLGAGPDGFLGYVLYNLDEFDESTAQGWVTGLRRILDGVAADPDQDWRLLLAGPAAQGH